MKKNLGKIFKDFKKIRPDDGFGRRSLAFILAKETPRRASLIWVFPAFRLGAAAAGLAVVFLALVLVIDFVSGPRFLSLNSDDFRADIGNLSLDIDIELAEVEYYQESGKAMAAALSEAAGNGNEPKVLDVSLEGESGVSEIDRLLKEIVL